MGLKTKSIYEPRSAGDGLRILITRYYPRGVKKDRFDMWVRTLSPSGDLLHGYRSGMISWSHFVESFLSELRSTPESLDALRWLARVCRSRAVTLLCYEREGEPCHRHIVKDMVSHPAKLSAITRARRNARPEADPAPPRIRFYPRRKVGRKARK